MVLLWGRGRFPFTYVGSQNGALFFPNVSVEEDQFLDKADFIFLAFGLGESVLVIKVSAYDCGIRAVMYVPLVVILCSQIVKAILY